MDINHRAPLVAERELFIEAPVDVVWKLHTAINDWPRWQTGVGMAKLQGRLEVGAHFIWKSGGLTITSTIQVLEPGEMIAWTGRALGTQARHVWLLSAHDGGTMLKTRESLEGWLVSILKVFTPKFLDGSLESWIGSIKTEAEAVAAAS